MLALGESSLKTLELSTQEIQSPLLAPGMADRVAVMLNYFLSHLAGTERKNLAVQDPESVGFRPHELLHLVVRIYGQLHAADTLDDDARLAREIVRGS